MNFKAVHGVRWTRSDVALCIALFAIAVAPIPAPASNKKHPPPPPAPPEVVARVRAAHSIFVSNATVGTTGPWGYRNYYSYAPYREMYSALAAWPGVKLVDSPSQADLVFQVTGSETTTRLDKRDPTQPLYEGGNETYRNVWSALKILDPKTQSVLWKMPIQLTSQSRFVGEANFAYGTATILSCLQPQQSPPKPSKAKVPVPQEFVTATKVFLQPSPSGHNPSNVNVTDIARAALVTSKIYNLVDTPEQADMILTASVNFPDPTDPASYSTDPGSLLLTAFDSGTKTILWTQLSALVASNGTDEQRLTQSMPYALKFWKSLISKPRV